MTDLAERTPEDVRFADIGGQRIEYRWLGLQQVDHPVLVFLHEGLGCAGLWRDIPDTIAAASGCSALVFSRRGYGNSDPVDLPRQPAFMHDEALDMLPAVLDHFSIRNAILIGHSDGGSIALIHAGSDVAGGRILGLVTLAAHVFNEDACRRGIEAARTAYEDTDLRERLSRYHGKNVDIAFRGWNDVWLSDGFRDWNIEEFLPDITVPLLAIQGEKDEYGTEAQVKSIVSTVAGPAEAWMVAGCGHSPHLENRDEVAERIVEFITPLLQKD